MERLAALDWPVPLVFVALDNHFAPMKKKFRALADAGLM
jgi:hypothetical protein